MGEDERNLQLALIEAYEREKREKLYRRAWILIINNYKFKFGAMYVDFDEDFYQIQNYVK